MRKERGFFSSMYGADALSALLIAVSCLSLLIILLANGRWFALLAVMPALLALARILSRNTERRARENALFLGAVHRIRAGSKLAYLRIRDRKTHLYFACPCCKKTLRTERNLGEVTLACPGCRAVCRIDTGRAHITAEDEEAEGAPF